MLHLFMPETRELYDLETLWTVGAKFDPQCQEERTPIRSPLISSLG